MNLNKKLKQKLYPVPEINETLFKVGGFHYATPLDLNMVYYHIRISKSASNLCTIIIPWGNIVTSVYQWYLLTQQNSFQQIMNDL